MLICRPTSLFELFLKVGKEILLKGGIFNIVRRVQHRTKEAGDFFRIQ